MPPSRRNLLLLLLSIPSVLVLLVTSAAAAAAVSFSSTPVELTVTSYPPASVTLPPARALSGGGDAAAGPYCTRVLLRGRPSRVRDPSRFFHALRLRANATRPHGLELCFHRNATVGPCKCAASQWQKMPKSGLWMQAISPYDHRILDFRMPADPSRSVVVSTEEEFLLHRVVFFVLGLVLMVVAHTLSESVVFYYGGAMTIGIFLVILIILFQGMKLLPTGKKSSLAIFAYSSVVGMTTYFLHYLSGMLRSVLVEIGIAEDMHNPLGIFVLVCVILAGAWFGYWSVRKLVLAEDGSVDEGVAFFVEWSLLIISAVMILQSSLDYLFAFVALVFCVIIKAIARIEGKSKVLRYIFGFLRPLVAVVAKCQLCALDTHEKGRLFAQLVDLLQFYEGFGINNHSGTQLGDDDVLQAHYSRFQAFQLLAFKQEPKLRDFALSSIGSLHKRADLTKKLLVLSDVELQDLVCNKEHIIRWIGCMYPLGLSCLASTSSSPVSEAAI